MLLRNTRSKMAGCFLACFVCFTPSANCEKPKGHSQVLPEPEAKADFKFESRLNLKLGDTVKYRITKTRRKGAVGVASQSIKNEKFVTIKVFKVSELGYDLGWTEHKSIAGKPNSSKKSTPQDLENLFEGFTMVYRVDRNGVIQDLVNWNEAKKKSVSTIDAMLKISRKNTGLSDAELLASRKQMLSMFNTKEQVMLFLTREAQMLFFPIGREYTISKTINYSDLLPNPLGGEAIPTVSSVKLESIDRKLDVAKVVWEQILDPFEVERIMFETLRMVDSNMGKTLDYEEVGLEVTDHAEYYLSVTTGLVDQFTHKRQSISGGHEQVDILSMDRL